MLWYKAWLETRWRFLIGLGLLLCSAAATVLIRPQFVSLMPAAPMDVGGAIGQRIREAVELAREYRGYVWSNWFAENLSQTGTLFAVLLGTGGLFSSGAGTLFTLSMPASRGRLLAVRGATGLLELFAIVFVSSLLIPLLSPVIGETYGVGNALVHGACLFIVVSVFFSLAFLLSTVFADPWRPSLITIAVALVLAAVEGIFHGLSPYGVFRVMTAETFFRTGEVPWVGLLASVAVAAALYYAAVRNVSRRDF
jgi:hypothetical protein